MILRDQNLSSTSSSFNKYHLARAKIIELEEEQTRVAGESDQAQQVLVLLLISIHDPMNDPRVQSVAKLIDTNTKRLSEIVSRKSLVSA